MSIHKSKNLKLQELNYALSHDPTFNQNHQSSTIKTSPRVYNKPNRRFFSYGNKTNRLDSSHQSRINFSGHHPDAKVCQESLAEMKASPNRSPSTQQAAVQSANRSMHAELIANLFAQKAAEEKARLDALKPKPKKEDDFYDLTEPDDATIPHMDNDLYTVQETKKTNNDFEHDDYDKSPRFTEKSANDHYYDKVNSKGNRYSNRNSNEDRLSRLSSENDKRNDNLIVYSGKKGKISNDKLNQLLTPIHNKSNRKLIDKTYNRKYIKVSQIRDASPRNNPSLVLKSFLQKESNKPQVAIHKYKLTRDDLTPQIWGTMQQPFGTVSYKAKKKQFYNHEYGTTKNKKFRNPMLLSPFNMSCFDEDESKLVNNRLAIW